MGRRGDLSVILKSPAGTQSVLLGPRPEDQIRTGFSLFKTWPMMSVHYWGEPVVDPYVGGVWTLTIDNRGDKPCVLNDWQIRFYGTETDPQPDTVNEVPETVEEEVNFKIFLLKKTQLLKLLQMNMKNLKTPLHSQKTLKILKFSMKEFLLNN